MRFASWGSGETFYLPRIALMKGLPNHEHCHYTRGLSHIGSVFLPLMNLIHLIFLMKTE